MVGVMILYTNGIEETPVTAARIMEVAEELAAKRIALKVPVRPATLKRILDHHYESWENYIDKKLNSRDTFNVFKEINDPNFGPRDKDGDLLDKVDTASISRILDVKLQVEGLENGYDEEKLRLERILLKAQDFPDSDKINMGEYGEGVTLTPDQAAYYMHGPKGVKRRWSGYNPLKPIWWFVNMSRDMFIQVRWLEIGLAALIGLSVHFASVTTANMRESAMTARGITQSYTPTKGSECPTAGVPSIDWGWQEPLMWLYVVAIMMPAAFAESPFTETVGKLILVIISFALSAVWFHSIMPEKLRSIGERMAGTTKTGMMYELSIHEPAAYSNTRSFFMPMVIVHELYGYGVNGLSFNFCIGLAMCFAAFVASRRKYSDYQAILCIACVSSPIVRCVALIYVTLHTLHKMVTDSKNIGKVGNVGLLQSGVGAG
jgi:hypothetical protein